ncbi:MAG: glucans biosynthesis protein [Verrucomicrobia bacterium]|nr:MAG: glucans biosynthesis protein [Verrucomicrobiota bacterium]
MPSVFRHFLSFAAIAASMTSAFAQTWEREDVGFASIQSRARDLASKEFVQPKRDNLASWLKELTYDQYRDIRFNPTQALWATESLPFRAMFFHPGYLFRQPVVLNEFTTSHQQKIRLTEAYFNYGPLISSHGPLSPEAEFSGFRLHTQLNNPEIFDELIAFQGATYWRALGKNQRYGISARGIAINTGIEGLEEEFPYFREYWLKKPAKEDATAVVYALLDGPSYSGAYQFKISPGNATVVDVHAVLFARKEVQRLGLISMSSMFWFGENSQRRFDDFRPEVHDSDGLSIRMGTGERIWRPICNDSGKIELSFFDMEQCAGFGLLQRDRRFSAYEDAEAFYHQRPSLWIEPTSSWGPGRVMLLEIPATNELTDNVVALWEPAKAMMPGDMVEISYRQHWTTEEDPSHADGRVVATRTGIHDWLPNQRTMVVEFVGNALNQQSEKSIVPAVHALGANAERVSIKSVTLQQIPEGRWRLAFQLSPAKPEETLQAIGPIELRACLKRGDDYLTETWVHRVNP